MRRAGIVLAATATGLAAVLGFHTRAVPSVFGTASASTGTPGATPTTIAAGPPRRSGATAGAPSGSGPTPGSESSEEPESSATSRSSATAAANGSSTAGAAKAAKVASPTATAPAQQARTAVGAAVNYSYGVLSVSVTATGGRITKVGIASLDDGGNFQSQSIDQQSIPILEHQALQAQSANIQGVAGASYTSAGFQQSLQSALAKLGR